MSLFHTNNNISIFRHKYNKKTDATIYKRLYDDVGGDIKNIFTTFVDSIEEFDKLVNYENYVDLADRIYEKALPNNIYYESYRNLLIATIEGSKHYNNRMLSQKYMYQQLLDAYNNLLIEQEQSETKYVLNFKTTINSVANVKPEILEYVRRGYTILDENGKLKALDITILGEIRKELNIT
jgi:hypothetical protein